MKNKSGLAKVAKVVSKHKSTWCARGLAGSGRRVVAAAGMWRRAVVAASLFAGVGRAIDGHKGVSCTADGSTCYTGADENNLVCKVDMDAETDSLVADEAGGIYFANMKGVELSDQEAPVCDVDDPTHCIQGLILFVAVRSCTLCWTRSSRPLKT